jgi:hypothetical protein
MRGVLGDGSVAPAAIIFPPENLKIPALRRDAEQRGFTDRAVEKAIVTGAESEVVSASDARDRLLSEGEMGALLRYSRIEFREPAALFVTEM